MEAITILILDAVILWLEVSFVIILLCWGAAAIIPARWPGRWQRHVVAPCPSSLAALF